MTSQAARLSYLSEALCSAPNLTGPMADLMVRLDSAALALIQPVHVYPETYTQAKPALRCRRGNRTVWLSSRVTPRRHRPGLVYDVTGPSAAGELLTVHVGSGMLPLRILGGNVRVVLGSDYGNVVTVTAPARDRTEVHVWPGCKVTAYGVDPARFSGDLGRVRQHELREDFRTPAPRPLDAPF